jgi:hypothetical protein
MAFGKKNIGYVPEEKKEIDLKNREDLKMIKDFETELMPFYEKKIKIFDGRELTGFELYLHSMLMYRYSPKYPSGAVVAINADKYREAKSKFSALGTLWHRRDKAQAREKEKIQTIKI